MRAFPFPTKNLVFKNTESELLDAFDEALKNGVSTVELYELLELKASPHRPGLSNRSCLYKSFKCFRQIFWTTFFISVPLCLVALILCDTFEHNPLHLWFSKNYLHDKQCFLPSHPLIMEIARPIPNCSFCSSEKNQENEIMIEFPKKPSASEFMDVAYLSKPVIVRGGALSNYTRLINFETLKAILESERNGMKSVAENCQFLPFRTSFSTLEEAFHLIQSPQEWTEPWYFGWSNCHSRVVTKLREIFPRPDFLPQESSASAIDWIFIGSPGYGAAMHLDYVRRPSWQAQISGRKAWTIRPPPECENECPESISFVIESGDIVFLDTNLWYHETVILGNELSVSIGSEYD